MCGRRIEWRKKWERDWEDVRYCSDACRRRKLVERDRDLEKAILDLLQTGTICPSDAARAVEPVDWRDLMEDTRMAARRLVASGQVEITQNGRVVDPSTATGPIRIRKVRADR